jgi:hypothetical protein
MQPVKFLHVWELEVNMDFTEIVESSYLTDFISVTLVRSWNAGHYFRTAIRPGSPDAPLPDSDRQALTRMFYPRLLNY